MGRNIRKLSLLFAFVAIVAGMYSLCNRVGGYVTPKENSVEVVKKVDKVPTTTPTTVLTTVPTTKTKVNKTNKETVPTTSSGKNYPVIEKQFGEDGITYDNFCVKNYTDFSLDIATELKRGLPFKIEKNHQVQVLIFHTHTCESYLKSDTGYYPSDYYPRTTNNKENVTKETKHKNRRPYIILIFGICCGIAGKFGFDVYKYKKKRVTNKDEQN